jgi:hypothetical protein
MFFTSRQNLPCTLIELLRENGDATTIALGRTVGKDPTADAQTQTPTTRSAAPNLLPGYFVVKNGVGYSHFYSHLRVFVLD